LGACSESTRQKSWQKELWHLGDGGKFGIWSFFAKQLGDMFHGK
jgi:hypothetical protein